MPVLPSWRPALYSAWPPCWTCLLYIPWCIAQATPHSLPLFRTELVRVRARELYQPNGNHVIRERAERNCLPGIPPLTRSTLPPQFKSLLAAQAAQAAKEQRELEARLARRREQEREVQEEKARVRLLGIANI